MKMLSYKFIAPVLLPRLIKDLKLKEDESLVSYEILIDKKNDKIHQRISVFSKSLNEEKTLRTPPGEYSAFTKSFYGNKIKEQLNKQSNMSQGILIEINPVDKFLRISHFDNTNNLIVSNTY